MNVEKASETPETDQAQLVTFQTEIVTPETLSERGTLRNSPCQHPYVWYQDDRWEPHREDVHKVGVNRPKELERSEYKEIEGTQCQVPPLFTVQYQSNSHCNSGY